MNIMKLPYRVNATAVPHIYWVDLHNNGVAVEVAVMALDNRNGDLHFMRTDSLDEIDKSRLRRVLSRRDAAKYALWDLLSQQTLKNGMNALEFFHQFVKIKTISGAILGGGSGMRGFGEMPIQATFTSERQFDKSELPEEVSVEKKRAGRPPKAK